MPPTEAQRASPDALLALANREGRGHLKVFLGAAPGVGKTYAMLTAARAEKAGGRDVVVGLVETHGRGETEALVADFDVLPRKPVAYQNRLLSEFDIDAALARRPGLLLVDEYAHTNIPGSRHPKRWQDVQELLAAGIDVWTTLNIQHLESLNDVIQKITQVRVRETVPDRAFEDADEIVLVDLPPTELLQRLAEGKVYVQDTAARAVQNFFKPQNLTALRELALRRTAERIDTDLVERMQAMAIGGPWPAGERILACIGPDTDAPAIVRAAKRLADLMDAPWIVVTVDRPGSRTDAARRGATDAAFKLAGSLGGDTKVLDGNDIPAELLRFAKFENVTQIVIGRSRGGLVAELLGRSLPRELIRRVDGIAIHVVTGHGQPSSWRPAWWTRPSAPKPLPYVWATLAVAAAVLFGQAITQFTPLPNLSMVFLMAVLFAAVSFGIWPAVYASVLSFLAYNYFFIDPLHTFTVAKPHEFFALVIFLVVAVMTSTLGGRLREQAQVAANRTRATRRLYEFSRKLSALVTLDDIAEGAATEINASLARPAVVLIEQDGDLDLRAAWPPEDTLDTASTSAARWAFAHDEPAGFATATLPLVPWLFVPLRTPRDRVGVVGIRQGGDATALDPESRVLFDALAEQTAAALERGSLARDMVSTRAIAETERVRNTLLSSISHDFRTPLASILGSATSLLDYGAQLDTAARRDLLGQIKQEAESLDEMVRNLLAITRIDAGALELRWDWIDLREIAQRVVSAARRRGAAQTMTMALPDDLPLVRGDATLAEQAIGNVIGNAVTHTPAQTRITIEVAVTPDHMALDIMDDGPGIPADMLPRIFDKFVRARDDSKSDGGDGTGLGLAIAKGIMEAHGGSITAWSPHASGRGTHIELSFPREAAPKEITP
ncbi:MAG: osmosensitive channel signal transduction histidine kinase [Xanthobacteraceae bacterium]|nr:osmosensitive channel signal transduction histidine kinase [Xanthobacteraceae bacterium]